jgi:hypothetical protein
MSAILLGPSALCQLYATPLRIVALFLTVGILPGGERPLDGQVGAASLGGQRFDNPLYLICDRLQRLFDEGPVFETVIVDGLNPFDRMP